jgi:hypothetical protein
MSGEFMTFLTVLVAAPTALAIWIAVRHGKQDQA